MSGGGEPGGVVGPCEASVTGGVGAASVAVGEAGERAREGGEGDGDSWACRDAGGWAAMDGP